MLPRVLETEVMDTPEEARGYDLMDHSAVNQKFVDDFLAFCPQPVEVADIGTGTARIPILLCQRVEECRVMAIDQAGHMLDLAHFNVQVASLSHRIQLAQDDAKQLPYHDAMFDAVISNSIVHHIPAPASVLAEAVRICSPGGALFFRDLLRPADEATRQQLVAQYAGDCDDQQRQMFADSLHAALTLEEIRALVAALGFDPAQVQATSDRHWTWAARKA